MLDLVRSVVDEGRANLSELEQVCVSDIRLSQELIVIQCDEDHSLSFMQIKDNNALVLIYKIKVADESQATSDISYSDTIVVRHSASAY